MSYTATSRYKLILSCGTTRYTVNTIVNNLLGLSEFILSAVYLMVGNWSSKDIFGRDYDFVLTFNLKVVFSPTFILALCNCIFKLQKRTLFYHHLLTIRKHFLR